jgi:hypothetical protein
MVYGAGRPPRFEAMSDEADIKALANDAAEKVLAAYRRGFEAGGIAMRNTILKAASAPVSVSLGSGNGPIEFTQIVSVPPPKSPSGRNLSRPRAPKGLVGDLIRTQLQECPGLPISDLEADVILIDARIAPKTVGNELRRFEGKKYRREGYRWFLMGSPQDETPAVSPAGVSEPSPSSNGLFDPPRPLTPDTENDRERG